MRATYSNGCVKTSGTRTVTLVTTGCTPKVGTDKEDANSVINADFSYTCYPNPTSDKLNVEIKNSLQAEGKLTLYNALGQNIWNKNINLMQGSVVETIDLSQLAVGVYSLIFQAENVEKVLKVVKE